MLHKVENIVVFGSGRHCKVIIDIVEKQGVYHIVGLIDDARPIGDSVLGYEVLGGLSYLSDKPELHKGVIALGDNWARYNSYMTITSLYPNLKFIKAIHPTAVIGKEVSIGEGTAVMANAVINSQTSIGRHCIINTKSSVDHDGNIGDFATVAPGATLAGTVKVGEHSVVSLGANVKHNTTIGNHTVIGAGSTVLHDIPSNVVAYGAPARIIRERVPGDKYL